MPEEKKVETIPEAQQFLYLLTTHNRGRAQSEATEQLAALVQEIRETKRGGALVLTIKLNPVKGDVKMLTAEAAVTVKHPKADPCSDVFYTTENGTLQRNDPMQRSWDETFSKQQPQAATPPAQAKSA